MIEDNINRLEVLLADQKNQTGIFRAGKYWNSYIKRINYYIRKEGLSSFRSHSGIGKGYTDTITLDPFESMPLNSKTRYLWRALGLIPFVKSKVFSQYRNLIALYLKWLNDYKGRCILAEEKGLLSKHADFLKTIQTTEGGAKEYLEYNGQKLAFSYIEVLKRIDNASQNVNFVTKSTFMEIGGGFGANAHLLLSMFPGIKTCLYVDIPPMLHVATEYLRHHFGDRVLDYTEFKAQQEKGDVDLTGRIACLPPWCLESVTLPVDLAWNSCSFQEMDDAQISYYAKWLAENTTGQKADILALFYPFDTYERSEKRSIDLLSSAGLEFKTTANNDSNVGESLIFAIGKIKKAA